jgi:large subunit ribosomal protein L14
MIRKNSVVSCVDNTGVKLVKVFQVVGCRHTRKANLADFVWISVVARNLKSKNMQNDKQLWRFRRGSVHKAIIVQTKNWYERRNKTFIRWDVNAVILVDKKKVPLGTKVVQGIPSEVINLYPAVGQVCEWIV